MPILFTNARLINATSESPQDDMAVIAEANRASWQTLSYWIATYSIAPLKSC